MFANPFCGTCFNFLKHTFISTTGAPKALQIREWCKPHAGSSEGPSLFWAMVPYNSDIKNIWNHDTVGGITTYGCPSREVPLGLRESIVIFGALAKYVCLSQPVIWKKYPALLSSNTPAEIEHMPRLAAFLASRPMFRTTTWLGMYGGDSPKPVKLLSDEPFIMQLHRTAQHNYIKQTCNAGILFILGLRLFTVNL